MDPFKYVDMIDGDFDTIVRVTAATIIIIVLIIVFIDFTLLIFLTSSSSPLGCQAAFFFRLAGLFSARALCDE